MFGIRLLEDLGTLACFDFEEGVEVAEVEHFENVLPHEGLVATEFLILEGVDQFAKSG